MCVWSDVWCVVCGCSGVVCGVMYGVLCVDVAVCVWSDVWCVVCGCSGVWCVYGVMYGVLCVDVAVCGVWM